MSSDVAEQFMTAVTEQVGPEVREPVEWIQIT